MMIVDRVCGILVRLERRERTAATGDVEDGLVDSCLCRRRGCEAVSEEIVNVRISASQSSSEVGSRYRESISARFFGRNFSMEFS